MDSKIALKNAQDQEFSINHQDNAGAISIDSNDIETLSGNQTITGTKTFTSSPTAPTPTAGDNSTKIATTAFVLSNGVPPGTVISIAQTTTPTGYLKCNGALISRTTYADLFAAIGTTFGAGDGSTTFALPDLRGEFIRGWDDARGIDTGRTFGSIQDDAYENHSHTATSDSTGAHTHTVAVNTVVDKVSWSYIAGSYSFVNSTNTASSSAGAHSHTITVNNSTTGSTETRPRNIALLYCIKY